MDVCESKATPTTSIILSYTIYIYIYTYINITLRTKDLVKLDRFNEHVLLVIDCSGQMRVLSTNHCKSFSQLVEFQGSWYQFISISLFAIALYSCPQPVNVPSTTRNEPWNTLESSVNDPWTTHEPPGNHPWTTRETSVLETQISPKNIPNSKKAAAVDPKQ